MICFLEWKLKNDFGDANRYFYTLIFWSLSRTISKYGDFFPFCHCLVIDGTSFLFGMLVRKNRNILFFRLICSQTFFNKLDCGIRVTIDTQLLCIICEKGSFYWCKHKWKLQCEWRVPHFPPQWQAVLSTHLKMSFYPAGWCWRVGPKTA